MTDATAEDMNITGITGQCVTTLVDDIGPRGRKLGTQSATVWHLTTVECDDGVVYSIMRPVSRMDTASIAVIVHGIAHVINVGHLPAPVAAIAERVRRANAFLRSRFARVAA